MAATVKQLTAALQQLRAGKKANALSRLLHKHFQKNYAPSQYAETVHRYLALAGEYGTQFGEGPVSLVRAPGRVNLIGEHTDYNGCPVLPMAANRDMVMVVGKRADRKVVLRNLDPVFTVREWELSDDIPAYPTGDWGNYAKAGMQGVIDHLKREGRDRDALRGLNLVLSGTVPNSAGMSSSSALVVLAALVLEKSNALKSDPVRLADMMAKAEHYVGTQGGGMDQATSMLAKAGAAVKIDFFPLRTTLAKMPAGYAIVVSNTLVVAPKTRSAMDNYNRRPIECRLATPIIRKVFTKKYGREFPIERFGDLTPEKTGLKDKEIFALANSVFEYTKGYTLDEIAGALGLSPEETGQKYCRRRDGTVFAQPADGFQLGRRYRHVVTEWKRVEESLAAFKKKNMKKFGRLMYESHASCRDDYEISCPELDKIVELAREFGALGSRLTGAGFGGCAIALVPEKKAEAYQKMLIEKYYEGFFRETHPDLYAQKPPYPDIVFAGKAVDGAGVIV